MVCHGESLADAGACRLGEDVSEFPVCPALFGNQVLWDALLCLAFQHRPQSLHGSSWAEF